MALKAAIALVCSGALLTLQGCGNVSTTTPAAPVEATLTRHSLEHVDAQAVCNDGSPASYYFKPARKENLGLRSNTSTKSTQSSNVWVVFLQGGGWCFDEVSCQHRCAKSTSSFCSSKHHEPTMKEAGLFSPLRDELLDNANKAYVRYCTSDAHMGNNESFGYQFRGSVVVQAVLRDLVATHGLGGGRERDFVIFGGGSAGSRGAMIHLDYVPEMLGSAASNVDVVGFLDSPAWVELDPLRSSFPGFPKITQSVHSYANVTHLGTACTDAMHPSEQWKCMFGQYRLPTLTTPYFLVASQADGYQLGNYVGHKPRSDKEKAYAQDFAVKTRELLDSVKAASPGNAVFSWQCYNHYMSETDAGFDELTSAGSTMGEAFEQFLGWSPATTSPSLSWIDNCTGFACGEGCTVAKKTVTSNLPEAFVAMV